MKTQFHIKSFVLGSLLGVAVVMGIAADNQSAHRIVWEYQVVDQDLGYATATDYYYAQALTKKSADGWDIVSSRRINDTTIEMIARRPKQ